MEECDLLGMIKLLLCSSPVLPSHILKKEQKHGSFGWQPYFS